MTENAITKEIVDAAFRIHTTLSQQAIPVLYGAIRIDIGFRADLIVEDRVIVENQVSRGRRAGSQKAF